VKLLIKIAAVLLVVLVVFTVYGATLPKSHAAASMARIRQTPEAVWATVSDFPGLTGWRRGVTSVERLPDRDGKPVWLVRAGGDALPLMVVESEPGSWLKTVIPPDADLPFAGSRSCKISAADEDTVVTFIEQGEIYNPLFRALARVVFGYHGTLNEALEDLGRKFGEEVHPEPVPQAVVPAG